MEKEEGEEDNDEMVLNVERKEKIMTALFKY